MNKLSLFLLGFLIVTLVLPFYQISEVKANPTYEDFLDYTEVDTGNDRIQRTGDPSHHIDFVSSRNAEETYVYKDYGEDHFDDFVHKVDARLYNETWTGCVWGLSNTVDELHDCDPMVTLRFYGSNHKIYLTERYLSTDFDDVLTDTFTDETWYFFRIEKSGTSFKCRIWTDGTDRDNNDAGAGSYVEELSLTLHVDHEFRYVYGCSSWTLTTVQIAILDIENLDLQEGEQEKTFYGEIPLTFGLNHLNTFTFSRSGTIPLAFAVVGSAHTLLTISGSIPLNFLTNIQKTITFVTQGTIPLQFILESSANIFQPGILNIYGVINLVFNVVGSTDLPIAAPEVEVTTFGTLALVIAIIALAIGVTAYTKKS